MYQLGPETGLSEIRQWRTKPGERVSFILTRNAAFAPCVEAIALAKLVDIVDAGSRIFVTLKNVEADLTSGDSVFRTCPPALYSVFGIQLAYVAESIADQTTPDIRPRLIELMWGEIGNRVESKRAGTRKMSGTLVGGQKVSIICRDPDAPIPDCLRERDATARPSGEKFRDTYIRLVRDTAQQDGVRLPAGSPFLTTFLYEAFANAHEHGRLRNTKKPVCFVRGILFERIGMHRSERAELRRALQGPIREYVLRMRNSDEYPSAGFLAVTIADVGLGIHNTLPERRSESTWARLNRAFKPGESSKSVGIDVQRGSGLDLILTACESLKALLLVSSGGEIGYFDGSCKKHNAEDSLTRYPDWCESKSCGTSLTLIFPSYLARVDPSEAQQPSLF